VVLCVLAEALKDGRKIRIAGDNVDWFTRVHDERLGHSSHMNHAFASIVIIDNARIDLATLECRSSDSDLLNKGRELPTSMYLPSDSDFDLLESKYTKIVAHIVCKVIPFFSLYADTASTQAQCETEVENESDQQCLVTVCNTLLLCYLSS